MKKIVITGGKAYADIDVLACALAYRQLLEDMDFDAQVVITGHLNQTIPESVRKWPLDFETKFDGADSCFVLVDLSDPKFMEEFVELDQVVEVFDHHYGHEAFWRKRLPEMTCIEKVGACATLVWERFIETETDISTLSANLLYTAIFANTLNFKSVVTTERDVQAARELLPLTDLPRNWRAVYYEEVAKGFHQDLKTHLQRDTKTVDLSGQSFYFGQIELWDARSVIDNFLSQFQPQDSEWLVNIASIDEGRSYLYTNSDRLREKVTAIVNGEAVNPHFQVADRLWLRKELLREFMK